MGKILPSRERETNRIKSTVSIKDCRWNII